MDEKLQKKIQGRQAANRQILAAISAMVDAYPELRFQQILSNLNVNVQVGPMSIEDMQKSVDDITNAKILEGYPAAVRSLSRHFEKSTQLDLFYEESVDTLARMNGNVKG